MNSMTSPETATADVPTGRSSRLQAAARWFLLRCATAVFLALPCWGLGVELKPGTVVEFASVEEGRRLFGERDAFIQAMSQFDRSVRMKTSRLVTEAELLTYLTNQVRTWSGSEQSKVSNIIASVRSKIAPLNVPLPPRIPLLKTTGADEADAAYCRGGAIVLPQSFVNLDSRQLEDVLIHELFHIFSTYNVSWRPALYAVIGFFECGEVALPDSLQPLKITNPDAFENRFAIRLRAEDRMVTAIPVIYSTSATYNQGGELFSYLRFMLMEVELRDGRYVPVCAQNGQPQSIEGAAYADYNSHLGHNTSYTIHPEEVLADNFVLLVNRAELLGGPRVVHLLRSVFDNPASGFSRLEAGWYESTLAVKPDAVYQIEVSSNLLDWLVYDTAQSQAGLLAVVDYEAWISPVKFYRSRTAEKRVLAPGSTNQMVWIAPGSFSMGSATLGSPDERPVAKVTITKGFWLGKCEVTQAEYQAVMGSNPSKHLGQGSLPVEQVTWAEATNYCHTLTVQEREAGRLPSGYICRLPTEAEWEYACRAGTSTPLSFGEDPDQRLVYAHAWFVDNCGYRPRSVGTKAPNAWGLHDMHGNVAEWCADWYGSYRGGTVFDPQGPLSGSWRIRRGGSFDDSPDQMRSAKRALMSSNNRWDQTGFRIALASAGQ